MSVGPAYPPRQHGADVAREMEARAANERTQKTARKRKRQKARQRAQIAAAHELANLIEANLERQPGEVKAALARFRQASKGNPKGPK